MNFEVLKKSHLKRNIIVGVVVVAVIAAIVLILQEQNTEQHSRCHSLMGQ